MAIGQIWFFRGRGRLVLMPAAFALTLGSGQLFALDTPAFTVAAQGVGQSRFRSSKTLDETGTIERLELAATLATKQNIRKQQTNESLADNEIDVGVYVKLINYSGHGIDPDGKPYLWPIDTDSDVASPENIFQNPEYWKYERSKSGTHYLKCVAEKCGESSVVSYQFQPAAQMTLGGFEHRAKTVLDNLERNGVRTTGLGNVFESTVGSIKLYSSSSTLSKRGEAPITYIQGLLVGTRASISLISTGREDFLARRNFNDFSKLIGALLALWEGFQHTNPQICVRTKLFPSCFGAD